MKIGTFPELIRSGRLARGTQRIVCLCLISVLASRPAFFAQAEGAESAPVRLWRVELRQPHEREPPPRPGTPPEHSQDSQPPLPPDRANRFWSWGGNPNLTLEVRPDGLRLLRNDQTLADIPGDSVVGVLYDTTVYRPLVAYFGSSTATDGIAEGTGDAVAEAGPLGILVLPVFVAIFIIVPAVLLAPFSKSQHIISIVWRDGDRARDVILQVKGREREAIFAAICDATGAVCRDVPAERSSLTARIKGAGGADFPMELTRDSVVAGEPLGAGRYQGLIVEGEAGARELLVFRGRSADARRVVARTPVEVLPEDAPVNGTVVTHRDAPAGAVLADVRVGDRRIVLPVYGAPEVGVPVVEQPAAGTTAVRFEAGPFARAEVTRATVHGEPAFRFLVLDMRFQHLVRGHLYVTAGRIVFDPADLYSGIEAPRSALRNVEVQSVLGGAWLCFDLDERSYSFRTLGVSFPHEQRFQQMRHAREIKWIEQSVAEFARLAIEDFGAASKQFDAWVTGGGLVVISEEVEPPGQED